MEEEEGRVRGRGNTAERSSSFPGRAGVLNGLFIELQVRTFESGNEFRAARADLISRTFQFLSPSLSLFLSPRANSSESHLLSSHSHDSLFSLIARPGKIILTYENFEKKEKEYRNVNNPFNRSIDPSIDSILNLLDFRPEMYNFSRWRTATSCTVP